jgi:MoxR-like ATPase
VQSALLEAMQEQQVTIGSNTFLLEKPFLVFATQNPIEQEGTYRLPEAQIDRFMFKLTVDYLSIEHEKEILRKGTMPQSVNQVLSKDNIGAAQAMAKQLYVDQKIIDYIVNLIFATRKPELFNAQKIKRFIQYGVSPRATLALFSAAQAYAFLKKRHFVIPDDVKAVAPSVLRHRLSLTYEAEAENIKPDDVIINLLNIVPTP